MLCLSCSVSIRFIRASVSHSAAAPRLLAPPAIDFVFLVPASRASSYEWVEGEGGREHEVRGGFEVFSGHGWWRQQWSQLDGDSTDAAEVCTTACSVLRYIFYSSGIFCVCKCSEGKQQVEVCGSSAPKTYSNFGIWSRRIQTTNDAACGDNANESEQEETSWRDETVSNILLI